MKKYSKYILIIPLVILVLLLANATYTFAKYVYNTAWEYHLKSKGFYFFSDTLNNKDIIDDTWDGASVHFDIRNNSNDSLITEYDIEYKVNCIIENPDVACVLNGTDSDEYTGTISAHQACTNNTLDGVDVTGYSKSECEIEEYLWEQQITKQDLYFDLIPNADYEIDEINVLINVESTSPYKKILSNNFILKKEKQRKDNIYIDYKDNELYGELIITNTYNSSKEITLSWEGDLLAEKKDYMRDYKTNNDEYINSFTFDLTALKNKKVLFYKKNIDNIVDIANFNVEYK